MTETNSSSAVTSFFGYALMTVGILVSLLSGTCTVLVLMMVLRPHGDPGLVFLCLIVGVPCFAIGLGLVFVGRSLARRGERKETPDNVF